MRDDPPTTPPSNGNLYTEMEKEMLKRILESGNPADYLTALEAIRTRLCIQADYTKLNANNP